MELKDVVETAARAAHEVNRAYQAAVGEVVSPAWDAAPEWMREGAKQAVLNIAGGFGPRECHEAWRAARQSEGWTAGEKDLEKRTHPHYLTPFDELPRAQKVKDALFVTTVRSVLQVFLVPVAAPKSEFRVAEAITMGELRQRVIGGQPDDHVVVIQGL